jgi:C4-type Zn-finger protein
LKQIEEIKSGKASMTLIIDDPTGNSAIIPDKAKIED